MKLIIRIISAFVFVAGAIWFMQGINVLPGSYMTGDPQWAINGSIAMAISAIIFWVASRKSTK
jgi:hypothetical protein